MFMANSTLTTAVKNELANVCWPALWLPAQADELAAVANELALTELVGDNYAFISDADLLVDSLFQQWQWQIDHWQPLAHKAEMAALTQKLRHHAAACSVCCIEKLAFSDFSQLYNAVKSLD